MPIRSKTFWIAYAILGVGILLSYASFLSVRQNIRNEAQLRLERQASDAHHKIEARIRSYIDIMYGLGALFRTSASINRAQFHRFVTGLDLPSRFPGFQSINYAEQVTHKDKARFVSSVRGDTSLDSRGYPQFQIKPPGERPEYHVLSFMEPMEGNEASFGLDLMGYQKERATAVQQMRDSGRLFSSGRLVIINAPKQQMVGLAMRLPVYRGDAAIETIEDRRATFVGSLGAGFLVKELLSNVLVPASYEYLRFRIYDAGPAAQYAPGQRYDKPDRLLFDSKDLPETPDESRDPDDVDFVTKLPLEMAGRMLETHFSAARSTVVTSRDAAIPYIVLAGGILTSLLLFGIAYSLATSRSRAIKLAERITHDLRASEKAQRSYAQRLKALSRRLVEVQEAERRTLAGELHDRIGQSLTAIGLNLSILRNSATQEQDPAIAERLEDSTGLVHETIGAMRNLMGELRPQGLDDYGLAAPLRALAAEFAKRTGIPATVHETAGEWRVGHTVELAMYRIAQETLNNVAKYAGARHVSIELGKAGNTVTLRIKDDGIGFDAAQQERRESSSGYGLQIMRERAEAVGASLRVESGQGLGTVIIVEYSPEQN
jgi:signal transduction histidine kinase/sensor domain CHASE-containing protein